MKRISVLPARRNVKLQRIRLSQTAICVLMLNLFFMRCCEVNEFKQTCCETMQETPCADFLTSSFSSFFLLRSS